MRVPPFPRRPTVRAAQPRIAAADRPACRYLFIDTQAIESMEGCEQSVAEVPLPRTPPGLLLRCRSRSQGCAGSQPSSSLHSAAPPTPQATKLEDCPNLLPMNQPWEANWRPGARHPQAPHAPPLPLPPTTTVTTTATATATASDLLA